MTQPSVFAQIDVMVETQTRSGHTNFSLPASVVSHFERAGIEPDEVYRIIGPKNEIVRRVKQHANLTPEQAERASRLAHVVSLAERILGKRENAFLWLRLPNRILGNKPPIETLSRESGARLVEEALLQMEYGVYS
ncbi:MAG: antitoxin Xre/MbcA/ParS toxin-binding domain-containing protein [Roseiarcus sp.]